MANPLVAPGLADRLRSAMALRGQSFRNAETGIRQILGTKTTGAGRGQLQNYVRDRVHNPRIDVLQAWAETLNVRVDWLIKEAGPPTREEADASEAVARLLAGPPEDGMEIPVELREAVELAGGTGIVWRAGPAGVQAYLETVRRLVRLHGSSPSISTGEVATLIRTLNRHMGDLYRDFAMGVALLPPKRGFRAVLTSPTRPSDKLTTFVVAFTAMIMAILPDPK